MVISELLQLLGTLFFVESHSFIKEINNFDNNLNTNKVSVREKFLNSKKYNMEQIKKIKMFDRMNSNNTVFIDDILHMARHDSRVTEIENSFREMLAMRHMKYISKRDFFWRTWRAVETELGNVTVVCYRCQNDNNMTKNCGGYWIIEDKPPPCPYEIFYQKNDRLACVVNYTQYPRPFNICSSVISVRDLRISCGNPIKTRWRITKTYVDVSESKDVICQGRESCDISTLYSITPNYIVFRLINSTDHIFYSRVMKSGNKNYMCTDDCGKIDLETNLISKNEQQFRLDMFKKSKREDFSVQSLSEIKRKKWREKNMSMILHRKVLPVNKRTELIPMDEHNPFLIETKNKFVNIENCKEIQEKYYNIEKENNRESYDY